MKDVLPYLSGRLLSMTSELRTLENHLKCGEATLDKAVLEEFREAIDEVRLTAWTASELMNARQRPKPLLSFIASERMRRLSSMIRDLCAEIDQEAFACQSSGVQELSDAVLMLQSRMTKLIARHQTPSAGELEARTARADQGR